MGGEEIKQTMFNCLKSQMKEKLSAWGESQFSIAAP